MESNESSNKKQDNIQFLYLRLLELYLYEKKLVSERSTIFLAFNSLIFIAFLQVLFYLITNSDKLGEGYALIILIAVIIPVVALFTCILQKYNIKCAIDASHYWKEKIIEIEKNEIFLSSFKKLDNEKSQNILGNGLFNDRKSFIDKNYNEITAFDFLSSDKLKKLDLDFKQFNPNTITQMWLPFAVSLIWISSLATLLYYYNSAYYVATFLLAIDMFLMVYLKGDMAKLYSDNKDVKLFLNAVTIVMLLLIIPGILSIIIGFGGYIYQSWNNQSWNNSTQIMSISSQAAVISNLPWIISARTSAIFAFIGGSFISTLFYFFGTRSNYEKIKQEVKEESIQSR